MGGNLAGRAAGALLPAALLAGHAGSGCIRPQAFSCEEHAQCRDGEVQGICYEGQCAFPDDSCTSGYAFARYAADAGRCVPGSGIGEGSTTTAATASSSGAEKTVTDSGSGEADLPPQPLCGGEGEPCCDGQTCSDGLSCNGTGCSCIEDVFAGRWHSCAVTSSRELWCWGRNDHGALGRGATEDPAQPQPVRVDGLGAVAAAAAHSHTCAESNDGQLRCWGQDSTGQVTSTDVGQPVLLPLDIPWGSGPDVLATGNDATCVALTDRVDCWGRQTWGFTDDPSVHTVGDPGGVLAQIESMGGGGAFYCALDRGGDVWCWGADGYGQLGDGEPRMATTTPVQAALPSPATQVSAGGNYVCAVLEGGEVACWGQNACGELGAPGHIQCADTGSTQGSSSVPLVVELPPQVEAVQVEAFAHVTCVVGGDRELICWGDNRTQQFLGAGGDVAPPTDALQYLDLDRSGVADVGLGLDHVCVQTGLGVVWCWGRNDWGQLGLPDTEMGFQQSRVDVPCQ